MKRILLVLLSLLSFSLNAEELSIVEQEHKTKNEELFELYKEASDIISNWDASSNTKELMKANTLLRNILKKDTTYVLAYQEYSNLFIHLDKMDYAKKYLDRAIELFPEYEQNYITLYRYNMKNKEFDLAQESLDKAKELKANKQLTDLYQAKLYEKQEKYEKAYEIYKKLEQEKKSNLKIYKESLNKVIEYLKATKDFEQAKNIYKLGLEYIKEKKST